MTNGPDLNDCNGAFGVENQLLLQDDFRTSPNVMPAVILLVARALSTRNHVDSYMGEISSSLGDRAWRASTMNCAETEILQIHLWERYEICLREMSTLLCDRIYLREKKLHIPRIHFLRLCIQCTRLTEKRMSRGGGGRRCERATCREITAKVQSNLDRSGS